jgi:hypothetical protein
VVLVRGWEAGCREAAESQEKVAHQQHMPEVQPAGEQHTIGAMHGVTAVCWLCFLAACSSCALQKNPDCRTHPNTVHLHAMVINLRALPY